MTSKSGDPIIELRGHLLQNIFHRITLTEQNFLAQMSSRTDFNAMVQVRLMQGVASLVRLLLSILQTLSLVKTLFGVRDEATLRFFKDHVELNVQPIRFWVAGQNGEQSELSWQHTGIHGKRRTFLFVFKRCHLYLTQEDEEARVVDLGPMPEAAFHDLLNRLQAFASSSSIRRQIAANPYRFQAEGMQRLAVAIALLLFSLGTGLLAIAYGPQLLHLFSPEITENKEEQSALSATATETPSGTESKPDIADDLAFLLAKELKYRDILNNDPNNVEAREGLALLAEQYVSLARKAIEERQLARAEELVGRAEQIDPDLSSIPPVKDKIRRLRDELQVDKNKSKETAGRSPTASKPQLPVDNKKFSYLVDNGDGTITDTRAGLVVVKTSCLDQDPWEQSVAMVTRLGDGQCGLADDSAPGDWRLPNKEELISLLEWEKSGLFSVARGRSYWSGTTHFGDEALAWYVDVKSGYVDYGAKQQQRHHVWPVRNEAPAAGHQ